MHTPDDRIEELIAAAVAGDLSAAEGEELRRLSQAHPWIEVEIDRLRDVAARVGDAHPGWTDTVVTEALRERILGGIPAQAAPVVRLRRPWLRPLIGAACLVVGLAIGAAVPAVTSLPPSGPPGTLGAHEPLVIEEESGIDLEADLVAHTWGTEAILDVRGLTVDATYRVVFIGEDGAEYSAGEMLGSSVPIHCRLNAAVLREQAVRMEIRDDTSTVIASADLPDA